MTGVLLVCLLLLSLSEYFSTYPFTQSWIKYSKKKAHSDQEYGQDSDKSLLSLPIIGRILVYITVISLFFIEFRPIIFSQLENRVVTFKLFLSYWVIVCTCFLILNYAAKLIAHIGKFEFLFDPVTAARNYQRGLLSVALYMIFVFYYYAPLKISGSIILISVAILFSLNILILLYSMRSYILHAPFYFIMYLCALEIAPYLLLYKYIIA